MANVMEDVAKLLGLELEEEFKIGKFERYKFTVNGLMFWSKNHQAWVHYDITEQLLLGRNEIVKLSKPILTESEKEYLSNIINHEYFVNVLLIFMGVKLEENRISIMKKSDYFFGDSEWISIEVESEKGPTHIDLPPFKEGTMYKGMRAGKQYTLEELEL